jgi:carbohydrate diacid regulator
VREEFNHPDDLVAELTAGRIGVLCHLPVGTARDLDRRELTDRCLELVTRIWQRHSRPARVGIGEPASRLAGLHDSYTDTAAALRLAPMLWRGDTGVFPISALRPYQLLAEVNPRARDRFRAATLASLRGQPDWPVLREPWPPGPRAGSTWCARRTGCTSTATA